jgi:hypothetical protein
VQRDWALARRYSEDCVEEGQRRERSLMAEQLAAWITAKECIDEVSIERNWVAHGVWITVWLGLFRTHKGTVGTYKPVRQDDLDRWIERATQAIRELTSFCPAMPLISHRKIVAKLLAATLAILMSCASPKPPARAHVKNPADQCLRYKNPTHFGRCDLFTSADGWRFIPEIGRAADLDTQIRCAPVAPDLDVYAECIGRRSPRPLRGMPR